MTIKDSLLGVFIIVLWGFNFVVIAWGLTDLPPILMGTLRFLTVAVVGSLFIKKPDIPLSWMALYALTLCFLQFAFLFSAMDFGMPAGLASLVLQSQALFTIMLSAFILREAVKWPQLLAMIIAGLGLTIIGFSGQQTQISAIAFGFTLAAAFAWASGNVINRIINQRGHNANIGLVVWSSWLAIIPFLLTSIWLEGAETVFSSLTAISGTTILVILYLGLAGTLLGYSLWGYLLSRYPAVEVAPLTLGVPVVGIICSAFFLNERLSVAQIIGILLVMLGLLVNVLGAKLWLSAATKSAK